LLRKKKKNPTTTFIQLLRTEKFKNKQYNEKNTKKEEKRNFTLM
jgi:hypothetical protein